MRLSRFRIAAILVITAGAMALGLSDVLIARSAPPAFWKEEAKELDLSGEVRVQVDRSLTSAMIIVRVTQYPGTEAYIFKVGHAETAGLLQTASYSSAVVRYRRGVLSINGVTFSVIDGLGNIVRSVGRVSVSGRSWSQLVSELPGFGEAAEADGGDCQSGGAYSADCSVSGCSTAPTGCSVGCRDGNYACCNCSTIGATCDCIPILVPGSYR